MALSKYSVKNGVYSVSQQGTDQPLEADDKEELDETASLFMEAYILKKGDYTLAVKGIEQVEGKDAYNVEIKSAKGRTFNLFYELATGLRLKEQRTEESPAGKQTIQIITVEYKTFNGVKLPVQQVFDAGQFKLNITIPDVKVNQGLKVDDLK